MPDEFEIPETPEATENRHERRVGLIIAVIAVVLAVVTHLGNETNNEKIVAHVDASDKFAFFQAKKQRITQFELQSDMVHLQFDRLSPEAQAVATRHLEEYGKKIETLKEESADIQSEGHHLLEESLHLHGKATFMELGEIALQISIVLCSITILTEQDLFVNMGMGTALLGSALAAWGFFFAH